jgi:hypothetical protein
MRRRNGASLVSVSAFSRIVSATVIDRILDRYKRLEVVRLKGKQEQGENPWRVRKQRVELSWQDMGS